MFAIGTVIERYRIEAILGEGGMATVYRVRHEQLDTLYALKVLGLDGTNVRERLLREGKVQASLRHPNIVEVRDVLDVNGAPGLLMEFIDGVAMDQWLERHQPDSEEALTLFRGILAGVGHAHAEGFIHRDLKPANVMLQVQGDQLIPKITDFGLAKLIESPTDQRKTRTGSTMGTPSYMPPEQFSDASSVDRRADLYALGCILYELFCGRKPFDEPKLLDMFAKIRIGSYPAPREINPAIPEAVARCIEKLVTVEPENRLSDCAAILNVLDGGDAEPSGQTLARARPANVRGNTSLQLTTPGGAIAVALAVEHKAATEAAVDRIEEPQGTEETMISYSEPSAAAKANTIALDSMELPPAQSNSRTPVLALVGLALIALIVLFLAVPTTVLGVGLLWGDSTTTATPPEPTNPEPTTPEPTTPEPANPEPVVPDPAPPGPVAPEPANPVPEAPAPTAPEPASPPPTGPKPPSPGTGPRPTTPSPEPPAGAGAGGTFSVTGARSAVLISGSGKTFRAGSSVPAGSYTIMATFDGSPKATPAGKVQIVDGANATLSCKANYQRCVAN